MSFTRFLERWLSVTFPAASNGYSVVSPMAFLR
jgi:hypothetical protein